MFWGDQDEERARHSLSDALSHLRRVLGPDSITTRRTDVALGDGANVSVDALELAQAAQAKNWQRVAELYTGQFLDFVDVEGSASFEQWATREREHVHGLFIRACASHCLTLARARQWDECAVLAARWLDAEPLSPDAALYLLNALKAPGTRDADARALAAYEQLAARLAREYQTAPDRSVSTLAADIANRMAASSTDAAQASRTSSAERASVPPGDASADASSEGRAAPDEHATHAQPPA